MCANFTLTIRGFLRYVYSTVQYVQIFEKIFFILKFYTMFTKITSSRGISPYLFVINVKAAKYDSFGITLTYTIVTRALFTTYDSSILTLRELFPPRWNHPLQLTYSTSGRDGGPCKGGLLKAARSGILSVNYLTSSGVGARTILRVIPGLSTL